MAYLGCAISTYGIGVFVQHAGWKAMIFGWLLMTVVAMMVCFMGRKYILEKF